VVGDRLKFIGCTVIELESGITFPSGEMVRTKSDDMWIEPKKARSQQAMSRQFARWMKHPREWMGQGSKTMEQVHRERQKSEVKTCYRCDSRFMGHKEGW
jgi:hypothetical protein